MQVCLVDGLRLPGIDSNKHRGDGDASSSTTNGRMYQQTWSLDRQRQNKL